MTNCAAASTDAETRRLEEDAHRVKNWKRWGPYLSERQWGTVREDYSPDSDCWNYFPHDHARSRAYRWGEDGLLGFTDRECRLCFAVALWNEKDPILKERLFGLTGPEGNHGEDVKESYYYLDSTPTHSYCKALYKYPQAAFPYDRIVAENRRRSRLDPEFELVDTGVFDGSRYFDVFAEYAKDSPDDVWIRLTVHNRGPDAARLHLLPTLWFRNTWSWGCSHEGCWRKPFLGLDGDSVLADHVTLGRYQMQLGPGPDGRAPKLLFTDNETNTRRIFGGEADVRYCKDALHEFLVHGRREAINPQQRGTKMAAHYVLDLPPGGDVEVLLRLCPESESASAFPSDAARIFADRINEADDFHELHTPSHLEPAMQQVVRQARAGLLWSKQFYHYVIREWLEGDPEHPPPAVSRWAGRNNDWRHFFARDVLSMPDKWEYPWFAAWDLAFHMLPFARIDPSFAKHQLVLMLREWYMHPSGQVAAYEFNFSDVNPPVHAWACWRVYRLDGSRDRLFLARVFQKLLLNFTWWVNRKDVKGKHLFAGGFLGLDNIGVFDRSQPLPSGVQLEQADGTAWMAFFCGTMLAMALELASRDQAYEDVASKFFEHFVAIVDAMNALGGVGLWNDDDGLYYDQLYADGQTTPLRIRSLVGLLPLIAVGILEEDAIDRLPGFRKRLHWFLDNRPDLAPLLPLASKDGVASGAQRLLAIAARERLVRVLRYVLDENEFLSPYGLRSLSRYHKDHPYTCWAGGGEQRVVYTPGESDTAMFGGNSNWRGPIWFPVNYLIIEALKRYHHFYGDDLKVECPVGFGKMLTLGEVAEELSCRLARLFLPGADGFRPCHGRDELHTNDPHSRDLILFHEYFHGDTGAGLGASHQTGWTALIASLLTGDCLQAHQAAGQVCDPDSAIDSAIESLVTAKGVQQSPTHEENVYPLSKGPDAMLIGYVSDERDLALADVLLELTGAAGAFEARSRAGGTVVCDLPPGEYSVTLQKAGCGSKRTRVTVPGTGPHRFRLLTDGLLGYVWPKCVRGGEKAEFRIHAIEQYHLELWRYGWQKEFVRGLGWYDEHGPRATQQITPDGDYTQAGVKWNQQGFINPLLHQNVEAPERTGLYYFHARTPAGLFFSFPWVVAPAKPQAATAVLLANLTWNAYNNFGGRSNYISADALPPRPTVNARQDLKRYTEPGHATWGCDSYAPLSFDRPEPINHIDEREKPTDPIEGRAACHIAPAEWRMLAWLEREGFAHDVWTETQLHDGTLDLSAYRALVLGPHPEYWTRRMYERVKRWVFDEGGRLMYLGGNGLNCEVEMLDDGRMVVHNGKIRGLSHEILGAESRFALRVESEANLLGVVFDPRGIMTGAPYRVEDAAHWAFAGTGLKTGDVFGVHSLHRRCPGGASGHETDKISPCSPKNVHLLARGLNVDNGGAHLSCFETPSGGAVFSTGSICWCSSLLVDAGVSTVTANVLRRFGR